ncbi:MAG: DUF6547 family protein [Pseudomarimonas sp.]
MTLPIKPQIYRDAIDALVALCKHGQGQIGARRVRAGLWNANATADFIPEQHRINLLLGRLPSEDREIIAEMLAEEVQTGVFEALKVIGGQFQVAPFQDGYEGAAFNDFIGRMQDWQWPEK